MSFFDDLESRAEVIAGKVGISPDQVQSISAGIKAKLTQTGASHLEALEAVAVQHGLPVEKVQEVLSHCGNEQDIVGEVGNLIKGLFKG
jgi:hypothetical protein